MTAGWHVHYKAQPGASLCAAAWPGELLTTATHDVTCDECLRWIHA